MRNMDANQIKKETIKEKIIWKESQKKAIVGLLTVALFVCAAVGSVVGTKAVVTSSMNHGGGWLNSSTFGDRELPIYCVDTKENKIALSFDAAWGAEDFDRIMEILDKHEIKVTFFMTGSWVEQNPECVKTLAEKGHDLGNHSEHHYDMATISKSQQKEEIQKVHDKVKELTGYEMCLFRPPYGSYNNGLINTTYEMGYYPIQWNVDSLDWKDYGADSIIKTVCKNESLGPGTIILCHNGAKYTADALDELITNLKGQGYEFVKISDLIMKDHFHMDVTGKQIADTP